MALAQTFDSSAAQNGLGAWPEDFSVLPDGKQHAVKKFGQEASPLAPLPMMPKVVPFRLF